MAMRRRERRPATGGGRGRPSTDGDGLELSWTGTSERDWTRLLAAAGRAPIEQSWAYGDAIGAASPWRPVRGVFRRGGKPVALVQALVWSMAGAARLIKVVRGPLFLDPPPGGGTAGPAAGRPTDPMLAQEVFRLIRARWRAMRANALFWTPELPDGGEATALMRGFGMRRTVTGYSTAWLDLAPGLETLRAGLHSKWRNQLVRAEAERLRIRDAHGGAALSWLVERHDEHRRKRRFGGPTGGFAATLALLAPRPQDVLVLQAERGSAPLAAVLFLRHGDTATYYLAWSGDEGRAVNANNRLLWEGIGRLRAAGVRHLDLGGIDASMPGVSRFKLGLGAVPRTLSGTWV